LICLIAFSYENSASHRFLYEKAGCSRFPAAWPHNAILYPQHVFFAQFSIPAKKKSCPKAAFL